MTDEQKPCLAYPCDGHMKENNYDASLECSSCQFIVADESEYNALVAGKQAAIDAALESAADEIRNGMDDKFHAERAAGIVTRRLGSNPLADAQARIAELERERDRAIQHHERCAEKLFKAERELAEARKGAERYRFITSNMMWGVHNGYKQGSLRLMFGHSADEAIDAAMLAEREKG